MVTFIRRSAWTFGLGSVLVLGCGTTPDVAETAEAAGGGMEEGGADGQGGDPGSEPLNDRPDHGVHVGMHDEPGEDPCDPVALGCGDHATCVGTESTGQCVCEGGFAGDGYACSNIDECMLGSAVCDPHASCFDTVGSYTCECDPGFVGDGSTCDDVDECANGSAHCDDSAQCFNLVGSFACTCPPGFAPHGGGCVDIDECAGEPGPCAAEAMCTNLPGGFACACPPGYFGDGFNCAVCVILDGQCYVEGQ